MEVQEFLSRFPCTMAAPCGEDAATFGGCVCGHSLYWKIIRQEWSIKKMVNRHGSNKNINNCTLQSTLCFMLIMHLKTALIKLTYLEKEVRRKPSKTTEQNSSDPNSSESSVRCPVSRCRKMSPKAMSL